MPAREIFGTAIVALGSFNPAIFSPDWLERNNLIGADDARSAREHPGLLVTHGVSQIECDSFQLQVVDQRFSLTSKGAILPAMKDMAVGVFSLLLQTPVTAVGLNFMAHYKMPSVSDYHKVGDTLAPKDIWRKIYSSADESIGMTSMTIVVEPYARNENPKTRDRKQITVQPSSKVRHGVYFAFNNHFEINSETLTNTTPAEAAREIIDSRWQTSMDESLRLFDELIDSCIKA